MDDQALLVVARGRVTEDATVVLVSLRDVLEPPRCPELLGHGSSLHFASRGPKILQVKRFLLFVLLAGIASGAAAPSAKRTAIVPAGVSIGGVRVGGINSEQARA